MPSENSYDALIPSAMAAKAEEAGVRKANTSTVATFVLAVLAGGFISIGAFFSTTVLAGSSTIPYGVARVLAGFAFSSGLIMVVVGGAELFTGNTLLVMALASRRISMGLLLRNWAIVYAGNFVGSIATAWVMFLTRQYTFAHGAVGITVLTIGETKSSLGFVQALALGVMCNVLVCIAVWLCFSARTTTDKVLSIIPPVTAFVAAGFEHSVANMYFIPMAFLVSTDSAWLASLGPSAPLTPHLTWMNFLVGNLIPVTLGNIIGGAGIVGLVYWFIYLRAATVRPIAARSDILRIRQD